MKYILTLCLCLAISPLTLAQQNSNDKPTTTQKSLKSIQFLTDHKQALQLAQEQQKPIIIYFTASWCGWCRKMTTSVFNTDAIKEHASNYIWLKVDIDDQPELANQYNIKGIPQTNIANSKGITLHELSGFRKSNELSAILKLNVNSANAITPEQHRIRTINNLKDILLRPDATPKDYEQALKPALELLSKSNATTRKVIENVILSAPVKSAPFLINSLNDKQLAHRAAAGSLVLKILKSKLKYDPFAKPKIRNLQINAIKDWLKHNPIPKPKVKIPVPPKTPPKKPIENDNVV